MIHQPSGGVQGQATDILIHAEEFLSPTEALEFGLIDKILSHPDETVNKDDKDTKVE